jgi:hypothetical protein
MIRIVIATDGKGGPSVPYGVAHTDDQVKSLLEKARSEGLLAMELRRT